MNKSKVILSAILVIVLCASLVCGATFALFTSESKVNIAVTSGKVAVTAVVDGDLTLSHQEADAAEASGYKTVEGSLYSGKAELDADKQTVNISNMVPMDKIEFDIKVTNDSNVKIQYRTVIKAVDDDGLFAGLKITVGSDEFNGTTVRTAYAQYAVGEGNQTIHVTIELPQEAGNDYQGKTCKLQYCVEAYQGNAKTPVEAVVAVSADKVDENNKTKEEIVLQASESVAVGATTVAAAKASLPVETKLAAGATEVALTVTDTANASTFVVGEGKDAKSFEISMDGVAADNEAKIEIQLYVGMGLLNPVMYHNGKAMDAADYSYDSATGVMTIKTATFSPFTVEYTAAAAKIESDYYETLVAALAVANAKTEGTVTITLLKDSQGGGLKTNDDGDNTPAGADIVIDFNGYSYTVVDAAVGSSGTETQAMHWGASVNSITLKNGKFALASSVPNLSFIMQNYITFTAEKMVIDGSALPVKHYGELTGSNAIYSGLEKPFFNNNNGKVSLKMTLKDCKVILPEESTKGIYNDIGELYLINTQVDGYVCFDGLSGKIYIDKDSSVKDVVPYIATRKAVTATEGDYTVYTVEEVAAE